MRIFANIDDFEKAVGTHLGFSEWLTINQQQVDSFADAIGDHQWIHTDPERAAAGRFGTTIAHGHLTLSLVPTLVGQIYSVGDVGMIINYGFNKVRFPAPVPTGSRIRAGAELTEFKHVTNGVQATVRATVEVEAGPKPACLAEAIYVLVP